MRWWPRDLLELMAPFHITMWMIVVGVRQYEYSLYSSLIMNNVDDIDDHMLRC